VRNPYNVGAILRSAAFFGVDAVLLGAPAPQGPRAGALAPDAVRVAEGGAEDVALCRTTDLASTLAKLRARGVHVIGAESDAQTSALDASFPRPVIVVVGHEREGMSERVRATCERMVTLPGRPGGGLVGSLNVAVTSGILCARLARR
jgi:TrmH RNA methyltransferase